MTEHSGHRTRSRYSKEFKRDVVTAINTTGITIKQASDRYDVPTSSIYNWLKQDRYTLAMKTELTDDAEKQELIRLRKENTAYKKRKNRLEAEAYLVKKATAFLASRK